MSHLKQALIFFFLCLCVVIVVGDPLKSQDKAHQGSRLPDFERFPTVDYLAAEPTDPLEREKRSKRAKRHNIKYAPRLDQLTESTFLLSDWDVNLPAFPIERSDAVVICRVSGGRAQLSEDRTSVYSEFSVQVETILKNDTKTPLTVDKSAELIRVGGRVRLPPGKIIVSAVNKQDMPQVGSRYVLFLTHHSLHGGEDEDLYILTGYEIKDSKVYALDKVSPTHPLNKYTGASETQFLTDLSSALANSHRL